MTYFVVFIFAFPIFINSDYFSVKFNEAVSDIGLYKNGIASSSLGGRFEAWRFSFRSFLEHPLWGIGVGNWKEKFRQSVSNGNDAVFLHSVQNSHNIYLDAMSTRGIIGLFSLLFFVLSPLVYIRKTSSQISILGRNLIVMSIITIMVTGMFDSQMGTRYVFTAYCVLIGISMAAIKSSEMAT